MNIEIKKSIKPIKYNFAINYMEKRLEQISKGKKNELIWTLEHDEIYTGGTNTKQSELKNTKNIKISLSLNITFLYLNYTFYLKLLYYLKELKI